MSRTRTAAVAATTLMLSVPALLPATGMDTTDGTAFAKGWTAKEFAENSTTVAYGPAEPADEPSSWVVAGLTVGVAAAAGGAGIAIERHRRLQCDEAEDTNENSSDTTERQPAKK